MERSQR
jgi:hypothetical protein